MLKSRIQSIVQLLLTGPVEKCPEDVKDPELQCLGTFVPETRKANVGLEKVYKARSEVENQVVYIYN